MLQTPERRTTKVKKDVDSRVPTLVQLRSVDGILAYKPIEVVGGIDDAPLLIVGVEDDPVTPTDHAVALYERARPPKKLLMQRHTTHYGAYAQYADTVVPQITDWFGTYLRRDPVTTDHDPGATT